MKKVYISGPMSGVKNFNFEKFFYWAREIKHRTFGAVTVVNPAEGDVTRWMETGWNFTEDQYDEVLAADLALIDECDAIFMMSGWRLSKGATMEYNRALLRGIPVFQECPVDLYIIGEGGHGKDTFAEYLSRVSGLGFVSSSWFMAERVVFPALKDRHGYTTVKQCFDDRRNHREEWYNIIAGANPTGSELSSALFKEHPIYVGLRNKRELDAVLGDSRFKPCVIWVDRSAVLEPEPATSMSLTKECANIIIDNNGSLDSLKAEAFKIACSLHRRDDEGVGCLCDFLLSGEEE